MQARAPVQKTKPRIKSIDQSLLAADRLNSYKSILYDKFKTLLRTQNCPDPGGCYAGGVWCRDAAYILEAMTDDSELLAPAKEWLQFIWTNTITQSSKNIVLGRGSPANGLEQRAVKEKELLLLFSGALPTTINSTYSEIYAAEPDIDSTALMIPATECVYRKTQDKELLLKVMPSVHSAMQYLESRDSDGDLLLEQGPNEDWMDVICRSGKIVYSQATWIRALKSYSGLLNAVGLESSAEDVAKKASKVARKANEILWNEQNGCYTDIIANVTDLDPKPITQDICSLLVLEEIHNTRRRRSLATIKSRLTRPYGRSVLDPVIPRDKPIKVEDYRYQNGGLWPWITAMECIALSRAVMPLEAIELISEIIPFAEYEWVNPIICAGSGARPFKTGIAAMYLACKKVFSDDGLTEGAA